MIKTLLVVLLIIKTVGNLVVLLMMKTGLYC